MLRRATQSTSGRLALLVSTLALTVFTRPAPPSWEGALEAEGTSDD